jgi:Family of unknown function (DUF6502)
MAEDSRRRLSAALLGALRPLAGALLKSGIGYKDFAEIAKRAFVDAASDKYGLRGRPTNVSRVAVLTGLSRKEVTRIRNDLKSGREISLTDGAAAGDVLNRWTTNASYLNVQGEALPLPFDSGAVTFSRLVREVAGDIPAGAIKFELIRAGCVVEMGSGQLRLVRRHYVPADIGSRLIEGIGYGLRTLAETVEFNSDETNASILRFQRVVDRGQISKADSRHIKKALSDYLTSTSHAVDDYMSKYRPVGQETDARFRIGVGLYVYEIPETEPPSPG